MKTPSSNMPEEVQKRPSFFDMVWKEYFQMINTHWKNYFLMNIVVFLPSIGLIAVLFQMSGLSIEMFRNEQHELIGDVFTTFFSENPLMMVFFGVSALLIIILISLLGFGFTRQVLSKSESLSFLDLWKAGKRNFIFTCLRVFGASLCFFAILILPLFFSFIFAFLVPQVAYVGILVMFIAIVLNIFLSTRYLFVFSLIVAEESGVFESFSQSWNMTGARYGAFLGSLFLMGLSIGLIGFVINFGSEYVLDLIGGQFSGLAISGAIIFLSGFFSTLSSYLSTMYLYPFYKVLLPFKDHKLKEDIHYVESDQTQQETGIHA